MLPLTCDGPFSTRSYSVVPPHLRAKLHGLLEMPDSVVKKIRESLQVHLQHMLLSLRGGKKQFNLIEILIAISIIVTFSGESRGCVSCLFFLVVNALTTSLGSASVPCTPTSTGPLAEVFLLS